MTEKNRLGHDPLAWMAEEEKPLPPETAHDMKKTQPDTEKKIEILPTPKETTNTTYKNDEWITISLPSILTLSNLTALQEQMQHHLGERVQLSGAQVERVDTAALQLLLAFKKLEDTAVRWVAPSPKLCKAAYLLGLTSELGLPAKKSAQK